MRKWYNDKKAVATVIIALILGFILIFLLMDKNAETQPSVDPLQESQEMIQNPDGNDEESDADNEEILEDDAGEHMDNESANVEAEEIPENDSEPAESDRWKGPDVGRTEDGLPDYSQLDPDDFEVAPEVAENIKLLEAPASEFVGNLGDSGIKAHGIQSFDGIFIETMKDTECSNVATILLENTTDTMISYLTLTLKAGDKTLTFEASAIPSGAFVLVQEKNASQYEDVIIKYEEIHIATEEIVSKLEEKIRLTSTEDNGLKITNISSDDIPVLRLFYKMKTDNVYVGGITYSITLENVAADTSKTVYPSHYVEGMAEVLMIKEYNE